MLIGTRFLYESFDQGDSPDRLMGGADIGQVTAMAYGGRRHGVANPDVAYIGTSGPAKILVRRSAGGAFRPLTAYRGDNPLDFAVGPRDCGRVYVVDARNHVWAAFNSRNSRTRLWTAGPISQISR
jgi:hypothetical protein